MNQAPAMGTPVWRQVVAKYENPELLRSLWQLTNSVLPYFALLALMYASLEISYWLTLALAVPAAGFITRIFIIFHDCVHGSFLKNKKANDFVGHLTGWITYTPFLQWRYDHQRHHATAGNLDARGSGDILTLTVEEYKALPLWKRIGYRVMRNPFVLFSVGALTLSMIIWRLPDWKTSTRERLSVHWTNLAAVCILLVMSNTIGLKAWLLIQLPVVVLMSTLGVWLFYVQHQFDGVYWERDGSWDFETAAMRGSSFYKLPKVLQWFTGNIGFHHIHHLSPSIPNYFLEKCHTENPRFQKVEPVTLLSSFKSLSYRLWDEKRRQLVGFEAISA